MASTADISAMPPPAIPQPPNQTSSWITQTLDGAQGANTFKRMSSDLSTSISKTSSRPTSIITTSTEEPSRILSPPPRKSLSLETNPFLTALAAQERRVLELREELQKAEVELARLKKDWAHQEVSKKKREVRQGGEAMRPMTSPVKSSFLDSGSPTNGSMRQSIEEERRRVLYTRPRVPERKVLQGRHARTLSLLSPGTLANRTTAPVGMEDKEPQTPKTAALPGPDDTVLTARPKMRSHASSKGTREDIVNTGKQLVGDLREGLWGFLDDLRQATVGDEAVQEPPGSRSTHQARPKAGAPTPNTRNNSSTSIQSLQQKPNRKASRSPHSRSATVAGTMIPSTPVGKSNGGLGIMTEAGAPEPEDDGWANWDSPASKTVASTVDADKSLTSTPRTSMSSTKSSSDYGAHVQRGSAGTDTGTKTGKTQGSPKFSQMCLQPTSPNKDGNAIPWPAISKLSPGNLQRTASSLMREWERSLTPPAEEAERDWIDRFIDGPRKDKAKAGY